MPAILRVLLGLRKCGFRQGGSSEPALSQQSHSETLTQACQSDVGRVGRPEADGRRGVSGPAWGMLGNSLLPEADEGSLHPRYLGAHRQAFVHHQVLPGAGPEVSLPFPLVCLEL